MKNKKTILVVEDEKPMLRALVEKLSEEGFNVLQAEDGETALSIATSKIPDLILLDIILPKMDGMTMLKELRKDKKGSQIPVILLTNLDYSVGVAKAMEAGAYDYLVKTDWTLDDVAAKARERLEE